ncbi:MAG: LCP family protein [Inconstantimicrobium porci]|uniref:LCP family protein n=1 Tax=Inconstantimicrobium porci TaxID=2652291 RepID=UPI002A909705|nr:LCP family protein [Inconstantimicrobium porci]MDY5911558.1 LCP family protein [Inconstantimicrobium porci]
MRARKKKKRKILPVILLIILFIIVCFGVTAFSYLNKIKTVKINDKNLGVTEESKMPFNNVEGKHKVKNILLMGVDNQENASDSNIVLSIDSTAKKIKMSSLMRDTYVDLGEGRPITKLNYAYHYGGCDLSVKTVNELFKLDITDYVKVDFEGLMKIIDYVGGLEINVNEQEFKYLNSYAKDIAKITNTKYTPISAPGKQLLNGQQATAYCRFRYDNNFDYGRTKRQRDVLFKLFNKFKEIPVTSYPDTAANILPNLETSLSKLELIELGVNASLYGKNGIAETRCPYDGLKSDATIKGIYYMKWDQDKNVEKLHKFIYFE